MNSTSPPPPVRPGTFEAGLENGYRLLERDPESAVRQAEALVRSRQDARAYRLAAAALRKLGLKPDAEGAELGGIEASFKEPELKKAAEAEMDGQSAAALGIARSFLGRQPEDLLAKTLAAESLMSLWQLEEAEALLRAVLERAPAFLRASMLLASCLTRQVKARDAIAVVDDILARKPDNQSALRLAANARAEVGDARDVVAIYERMTTIDPNRLENWVNLGHHYRIVGERQKAIDAFRHALTIDEFNGSAWWSLANYFPSEIGVEDATAIEQGLEARKGQLQEGNLHLAEAIIADTARDYPKAAAHFIEGKKIRLEHQPYDPEPVTRAVTGLIKTLDPEFVARRQKAGLHDPSPIFVLGMPRSGTTLVERILGRHEEVEGVGEMLILPRLAELARRRTILSDEYAAMLAEISDDNLEWVGRRYIEASRDRRKTQKPRFIDKANLNWMQVGLILLALPDAKIIDVRRDAVDCCWANFKMLFAEGYPAANDQRHVARFYRDYARLLDAMHRSTPDRILPVRYEDVVDDIEGQTRRMLDFVGLDYDPRCLDFHLATDAVATASSEQVRRPLNREGIGSADPYREWLGPMIEELGDLA